MRVFIVYCHPSDDSFTKNMCDAFIKGITDSGNEYIISDLYKMDFDPNMTEKEYLRDANYRNTPDVASDVLAEQGKIIGLRQLRSAWNAHSRERKWLLRNRARRRKFRKRNFYYTEPDIQLSCLV